ncbi:hypothetical protein FE633_14940 [Streptomyces montanus]|uniref:Uncharacterized protein n=1 Tax=Streptomyces montanus TaxID=2580423 RepID=A0A5R9FN67_9ACTN|nr:hypothetical protein [Streptomyces montanus]TLS45367.1 hypothetical protein FE633_14940 [Streptomyces montanus]
MDTPDPTNLPARREEIALKLGLASERVTDSVIEQIADDPLFLHHLELCKDQPEMLDMLLGESNDRNGGKAGIGLSASPQRPPAPGNAELLGRAGAALGRWIASGFGRVTDDEYRARLATCGECEHLTVPPRAGFYRLMGATDEKTVCGLCGCDTRRKAWLATEQCPDHRWKAATG